MNEQLIQMTKRLFTELICTCLRQRLGVRRPFDAFERLAACGKLQRAGALIRFAHPSGSLRLSISASLRFQNALAMMLVASLMIAARPVQAQWEPLPPLPEANGGFMCGVTNDKIVIVGGTNWEGGKKNWLKAIHAFDPKVSTWTKIQDHVGPVAYGLSIQRSICFSFIGGSDGSAAIKGLSVAEGKPARFKIDELPDSVVLLAGGYVKDKYILVGGTDDAANLAGVTRGTHSLTPFHDRWQVASLPDYPGKPFAVAASAVVGTELFVFGGMNYDETTKSPLNSTEAYAFSPEKNAWRKLRPLEVANRGLTAVTLDERHIYLAGGYTEDFTADAVVYDVKDDSYKKAQSLPYAAMVGLVKLDGFVYCLGGEDKKQSRTNKFFRIPMVELLK